VGGGENWSYKKRKAPVKSSPPTNQHPALGWMPFLLPKRQSPEGKSVTFQGHAHPWLSWGSSNLIFDH